MGIRGSGGTNPTVLTDQMLGNAYEVVRFVAQNIEYIRHVSSQLEKLYRIHASADAIDGVHENIAAIVAVHDTITQILGVHGELTAIRTVASAIEIINAVEGKLAELVVLHSQMNRLVAIHGALPQLIALHSNLNALTTLNENMAALLTIHANLDDLLAGEVFTQGEKDKLANIAPNATANQSNEFLIARGNHTGTQGMGTIDGLSAALAAKATPADINTAVGAEATARGTAITDAVSAEAGRIDGVVSSLEARVAALEGGAA